MTVGMRNKIITKRFGFSKKMIFAISHYLSNDGNGHIMAGGIDVFNVSL